MGTTTFSYIYESPDNNENKLIPFLRDTQSGGGYRELEVDTGVLTSIHPPISTNHKPCYWTDCKYLNGDGSSLTNLNVLTLFWYG